MFNTEEALEGENDTLRKKTGVVRRKLEVFEMMNLRKLILPTVDISLIIFFR